MDFIYYASLIMTSVMLFMIFKMGQRNRKAKKLVDLVNIFDNKEIFFKETDFYIETINEDEFVSKALIFKIWGLIYYEKYDEIIDTAKRIDFTKLIKKSKKGYSVELNEDSMYYYLLACQNALYSKNKIDLMKQLDDLFNIKEEVKDTLVYALYEANKKFYYKEDDLGEKFYKDILDGNYNQYDYSKRLIGLYKNITTVMLSRLYIDKDRLEEFDKLKEDLKFFSKSKIGKRFIQELKITKYLKEKE